jgi:hypothetical protein
MRSPRTGSKETAPLFSGLCSPARTASIALLGAAAIFSGCAEPSVSYSGDPSRTVSPVPACVVRLSKRSEQDKRYVRQLGERDYWNLVFPTSKGGTIPQQAMTCSGGQPFADPALVDLAPIGGWPVKVPENGILYGGGGNRLRVAWLKTHQGEDGTAGGALALVRSLESYAEVYGVGVYAGDAERTRLGLERMGHGVAVTATDDRCAGQAATQSCDTVMHVYLPFEGYLMPLTQVGMQRVRFAEGTEPGVKGKVRYELVTAPTFEEGKVKLMEQVTASDETGRKLRRAEIERVLTVTNGKVKATSESLWDRMVEARLNGGAKKGETKQETPAAVAPAAGATKKAAPSNDSAPKAPPSSAKNTPAGGSPTPATEIRTDL